MDLSNISNKYKQNLESFFSNEDVIEIIYRKQYGDKYYEDHEDECKKEFKEIMKNTVFIPYITMEHLEEFLLSVRRTKGDQYLIQNYTKELNLLKKLQNEKKTIIKNYSSFMLDELKHFYPKLKQDEYNKILKKCSNSSFEENISQIQDLLPKHKTGFFQKIKGKKIEKYIEKKIEKNIEENIEKCIEKYKKLVKDKITMETSSYFKHISDAPNGKYYTSILEKMNLGGQFVSTRIGKISDRNIRYIFLPVLKYKNKNEYLKTALHEVMHISKGKIDKNKYKTGLLESPLSRNPHESKLNMNTSYVDVNVEEVTHHWQVREAMSELLKKENLLDLLKMPYNPEIVGELSSYELFDAYTVPFMQEFNNDIQKVNVGKLSAKKFRNNLGKANFNIFSNEVNMYLNGTSPASEQALLAALITSSKSDISTNKEANPELEAALVKMKENSDRARANKQKRELFLEGLRSMLNLNITKNDKNYKGKDKKQHVPVQTNQSQNIHYVETR